MPPPLGTAPGLAHIRDLFFAFFCPNKAFASIVVDDLQGLQPHQVTRGAVLALSVWAETHVPEPTISGKCQQLLNNVPALQSSLEHCPNPSHKLATLISSFKKGILNKSEADLLLYLAGPVYTGQENAKSSNPVAIDGACPFAGLHIIEPDVVAELGQEEQRAEIAAAEMEQDAPPRLQAEEEEDEDMGTTEEECIYGAKLVQAGADGRTFFTRWKIAEGLWKRAIIQLPKLKLDVSGIPGVHGYGVWTMYDIAKNAPLTFYGGIVVSKKVARALRKLHVGYHTHMKGIGQAETDDCHVLIGHCTAELPLYYFLLHHFLGSFINANKGTGLKPNVREVHQELPFTHPYDKDLGRVSKHLLVVANVALPANTELLGTYDEAFWRETEESDHDEPR